MARVTLLRQDRQDVLLEINPLAGRRRGRSQRHGPNDEQKHDKHDDESMTQPKEDFRASLSCRSPTCAIWGAQALKADRRVAVDQRRVVTKAPQIAEGLLVAPIRKNVQSICRQTLSRERDSLKSRLSRVLESEQLSDRLLGAEFLGLAVMSRRKLPILPDNVLDPRLISISTGWVWQIPSRRKAETRR